MTDPRALLDRLGRDMRALRRDIAASEDSIAERRAKLADMERTRDSLLVEAGLFSEAEAKQRARDAKR